MNGAEHWKAAEQIAARAAKMTDLAEIQAWTALGRLELDLGGGCDCVLLPAVDRDVVASIGAAVLDARRGGGR